jgi:hypothetical protein
MPPVRAGGRVFRADVILQNGRPVANVSSSRGAANSADTDGEPQSFDLRRREVFARDCTHCCQSGEDEVAIQSRMRPRCPTSATLEIFVNRQRVTRHPE